MALTLSPVPSGTRLRAAWLCLDPPPHVLTIPFHFVGYEEKDNSGVMLGGLCLSARLRLHGSCHHFAQCCCSSILAAVLPSTFVPFLSILHPSSERLFKMQIRSVCVTHYPEIHQWLPLTLRIKSRVLTLAHSALLGVPSHHST